MNSSTSQEPTSGQSKATETDSVPSEPNSSIEEYYNLQKELFVTTLTMTGIIFLSVWIFYSLNTALNYAIGACVGVVYLRLLAKDVERLGREKKSLSQTRMALFVGLIIVATQWNQLNIIPIFLGFLTYKASLIIYVLRTTFLPSSK
ncbi:MAG: ATP synthase subunit I [Cyanobacteriota bacterium]|nr:ATP synthase subunit I [Cyanobacteriota bacterium]